MDQTRQAPVAGVLLVALAAVLWGTSGSVMAVLSKGAATSPLLVGVSRLWLAALLLLVAVSVTRESLAVAPRDRWRCVAMGACMAAYQAAYFPAVTLSGIAVVALVAICSAPLVIAALAPRLLGERSTRNVHAAVGLGVIGTALLVLTPGGRFDASARFASGVLLALAAGLAYAFYVVAAKASLARSAPLPLAALTFTVGAVLLTPALLWTTEPIGPQLALGWPWLVYLGAVATAGAYVLYTVGLRHVPAAMAGVTTLIEPLTATILAVALFGERLGIGGGLGAVLLVVALGLLLTDRR